jgi:hypothetical protein
MQGALIIFALISFVCAQQASLPPGGCCFYSEKGYQNEVACTNAAFTIAELNFASKATFKGIQSFFCEEGWSAAIISKDQPQELIECGDTVPETTTPIPTDRVTIGPCLQRRCCFYSGKNKDGNEYCMYADSSVEAELKGAQSEPFLVGECLQEWKAELTGKNGKVNIDCGVTLDLDAKNSYDRITLTPCSAPKAEIEAVVDTFGDNFDDTFQDQAVVDTFEDEDLGFVDVSNEEDFQADFAVADAENVEMLNDDEFLADASLDQAFADANEEDFAMADFNEDDALATADFNDEEFQDFNHDVEADFAADQAFADYEGEDEFADQFVGDYNDQAVMDAFNDEFPEFLEEDQYVDQAVSDFDQEGDNFDQVFEEDEFAADSN